MAPSDRDWLSIELGDGISRRDVLTQLGAAASVGAFGGLAGCAALQRDTTGAQGNQSGTGDCKGTVGSEKVPDYKRVELIPPPTELDFTREPPTRDIAMVTHDAASTFFVPVVAGLHDAARQTEWKATFSGPTGGFDVQKQVSILQSLVASGPDVIATTIADDSSYNKVIKEALSKGISVITYNTNAWSDQQMKKLFGRSLPFIGQEFIDAGYVCGLEFIEQLPDDANVVTIGTCCPGHPALGARAKGIKMAIQQNTDLKITGTLGYTTQPSKGVTKITNHITANPDLDGIVGTDGYSWFIGKALKNMEATESIVAGGFDLSEQILQYIKSGTMEFTIGQDGYSQGYFPTTMSWTYLDRGIQPKDYRTGAVVITSENIDFARERAGNWAELRQWQRNNK